jgi:hypothetical protein
VNRRLVALALLLWSLSGRAAEVDSFTARHPLRDAAPLLDQVVNVWLEEALIEANRKPLLPTLSGGGRLACDSARLIDAVKSRFAGYLIGQLETFANESTAVDKIRVPFADSIYRDFDFTESPAVALTGRLAVLLRLGDVYVGSDKLGHFFTEGYSYYELYLRSGEAAAIDYGRLTEISFYGLLTTGIFSWADLAANLNGMRFWNELLALRPDPLTRQPPIPLLRCEQGQWKRQRDFHWRDYVDDAWDEAVNCVAFRDRSLLDKAGALIRARSQGRSCPLQVAGMEALQRKYGPLLQYIFNPAGNRLLPESLKPDMERYWRQLMLQIAPLSRLGELKPQP